MAARRSKGIASNFRKPRRVNRPGCPVVRNFYNERARRWRRQEEEVAAVRDVLENPSLRIRQMAARR